MAKINTFAFNNMPRIADKVATGYVEKQQKNEPPQHPDGTLYVPGESGQRLGHPVGA